MIIHDFQSFGTDPLTLNCGVLFPILWKCGFPCLYLSSRNKQKITRVQKRVKGLQTDRRGEGFFSPKKFSYRILGRQFNVALDIDRVTNDRESRIL
jgi:hypothetical protein